MIYHFATDGILLKANPVPFP